VDQFIPSDMGWKGWVKMAFHQPLVPVLPVARELLSKTKWIASKGAAHLEDQTGHRLLRSPTAKIARDPLDSEPPQQRSRKDTLSNSYFSPAKLTNEPMEIENVVADSERKPHTTKPRSRMMSLFRPSSSRTTIVSSAPELLTRERSGTITPRPTVSIVDLDT